MGHSCVNRYALAGIIGLTFVAPGSNKNPGGKGMPFIPSPWVFIQNHICTSKVTRTHKLEHPILGPLEEDS